jgi:hypothetical protein
MKTLIALLFALGLTLLSFGFQKKKEIARVPEITYELIGQEYDHLDMAILLNEKYILDKAYLTPSAGVEFEFLTSDNQVVYFIYNSLTNAFSQVDSINGDSLLYYDDKTNQQFDKISEMNIPNLYSLDCGDIGCVWSNGTSSLLMTHKTALQFYYITMHLK